MELEQRGDLFIADRAYQELIVFVEAVQIEEMGLLLSSPPNIAAQYEICAEFSAADKFEESWIINKLKVE